MKSRCPASGCGGASSKRRDPGAALYSIVAVSEKCFEQAKMHSRSFSVHAVWSLRLAAGRFELTALMRVTRSTMVFAFTPTSVKMSRASQRLSCSLSCKRETGSRMIPVR